MGRTLLFLVLLGAVGCNHHSSAGFRLPEGDAGHGEQVFQDIGCVSCHEVITKSSLPKPVVDPPVPKLGGMVQYIPTDGQLVTSIINPSHRIAKTYASQVATSGGVSRMPDFTETMTVRQLVDLVAFVRSTYRPITPDK